MEKYLVREVVTHEVEAETADDALALWLRDGAASERVSFVGVEHREVEVATS